MYRLSLVINEIYNKYLPEAMKAGISFNLDFPDTTLRIKSPSRVKKSLDEHVGKGEDGVGGGTILCLHDGRAFAVIGRVEGAEEKAISVDDDEFVLHVSPYSVSASARQ